MKYGVREICDVVFKAKADMAIGTATFKKGQPVLYIDTAKTSTTEGAATTVYATGGRGNTRLIAWEGERTLSFTVEDALLSPISFAMLSGAGVLKGAKSDTSKVHIHTTAASFISVTGSTGTIDLTDALLANDAICEEAPIFVSLTEADGSLTGTVVTGVTVSGKTLSIDIGTQGFTGGEGVFVDFYITRLSNRVTELQIDAKHFGGYFYVEANTLWRDTDGSDHAAEMTFPNVKIQSNFTFNNAATGDPSTFTFAMDAFPGYTWFNKTRKVLLAMQIMDDIEGAVNDFESVFPHDDNEVIDDLNANPPYFLDSVNGEEAKPVTGITVDATKTVAVDALVAVAATIAPADATNKAVTWAVSDGTKVALFADEEGTSAITLGTPVENLTVYAKGLGAGSASVVVASYADPTKIGICAVTVTE